MSVPLIQINPPQNENETVEDIKLKRSSFVLKEQQQALKGAVGD